MAQDGENPPDDAEARLEPPSLFRRRRKKATPEPTAPVVPTAQPRVQPPASDTHPQPAPEPGPVVEMPAQPDVASMPEPEAVAGPASSSLPVDDELDNNPELDTAIEPVDEPVDESTPTAPSAAVHAERAPEPAPEPAPASAWEPEPTSTVTDRAPVTRVQPPAAELLLSGELEPAPPRQPWLTGQLATVVTGLTVGVLVVVLTAAGGHLCTAVKGTSSCGGGEGLLLLITILLIGVLVGVAMLRSAQLAYPGSTSVLAVGLLSVMILLFLVGSIFSWWMIIAIPAFSIGCFALSHWVTTAVVDDEDGPITPNDEPALVGRNQDVRDRR